MPRGPKGERRPADVIGAAVVVGRIATREIEDTTDKVPRRAKGGKASGLARAKKLSASKRRKLPRRPRNRAVVTVNGIEPIDY